MVIYMYNRVLMILVFSTIILTTELDIDGYWSCMLILIIALLFPFKLYKYLLEYIKQDTTAGVLGRIRKIHV